MKLIVLFSHLVFVSILMSSCAGTINTLSYSEFDSETYKKAYIVSPEETSLKAMILL